jgi:hypothetical protein
MRALPALVSAILLGAHFFRADLHLLAAVSVLIPALLLLQSTFAVRIVQAALVAGFFVWADALLSLYKQRLALGMPWTRMALILCAVAVFALVSAYFLEARTGRGSDSHPDNEIEST